MTTVQSYKTEVAKYGKKDAVIALCYVVYVCVMLFFIDSIAAGIITAMGVAGTHTGVLVYNTVVALPMVIPCFVIVLARKEKLSSIGIHKQHLWAALRLGLLFSAFAILLTYRGFLPGLLQGGQLQSFSMIMFWLLCTAILAAWEDVVFSGYVQTRLYGLVKQDILAVLIGALLFAVMHLPSRIAFSGAAAFNSFLLLETGGWIIMHTIHNLLFRKYFSIVPVILVHTFVNLAQVRLWVPPAPAGLDDVISTSLIVLAVGAWMLYSYYRSRKMPAPEES